MDLLGIESIEEVEIDGKKFTKIYWENGRVAELKNRAGTVLKKIALNYGKTPLAIRQEWIIRMQGESRRLVPLYISRALNFLPVKTKEGISYVNVAYNADIYGSAVRFLRSGRKILTKWKEGTLRRRMTLAMRFALKDEIRRKREEESLENLDIEWYLKNI